MSGGVCSAVVDSRFAWFASERQHESDATAAVSNDHEVSAMRKGLLLLATAALFLQTDEHGQAQGSVIGGFFGHRIPPAA